MNDKRNPVLNSMWPAATHVEAGARRGILLLGAISPAKAPAVLRALRPDCLRSQRAAKRRTLSVQSEGRAPCCRE